MKLEQHPRTDFRGSRRTSLSPEEAIRWLVAIEQFTVLTRGERQYCATLIAYIKELRPDQPKYLSGIEAAVSQLGQFIFQVLKNVPMESRKALLDEFSVWFSKMHPGHQLKIPKIGDGFDPRFHKHASSAPYDKDAVSIVKEILNWGLLEIGSLQRTVIKADVICRT